MKSDLRSISQKPKQAFEELGSNFNRPYLTPAKIISKMELLDKKLAKQLAETIIVERKLVSRTLPLKDKEGKALWYCLTPEIEEYLHKIDKEFSGILQSLIEQEFEYSLLSESIFEEAFFSSKIEGTKTSYVRAKELIDQDMPAVDNSEKMVKNNLLAMEYIVDNLHKDFDIKMILEIHRIVTLDAMAPGYEAFVGRFRDGDVQLKTLTKKTVYEPPHHGVIQSLMEDLIKWMNDDSQFLHPVLKASIFHFYFAYIHPFFDGNGRTARALFYFYLLKSGYNEMKFLSISNIINKSNKLYAQSFKDVEDNDSDLTYFLIFSTKVIFEAYEALKAKLYAQLKWVLIKKRIQLKDLPLNRRQMKLMKHFCSQRYEELSVRMIQNTYKVDYEETTEDLDQLVEWGFLEKSKTADKDYYSLVE